MTQTRRDFIRNSAMLAAAFATPFGTASAQERVALFKWVPHADLSVVDPMFSTSYITQIYAMMVFDTLFGLDENYEAQPQMAETHEVSEDRLIHVITLRDGLTFHDGTPVTAEDCVASIKRWMARSGLAKSLVPVTASVEATDTKTITFTLNEPFPLLAMLLARPQSGCAILPASEANSEERLDRPTGSGPYKMVWDEWVLGSRIVFERHDGYVPRPNDAPARFNAGAKIAMIDRIEWQIVPDAATAIAAIQSNEVDGVETVSTDFAPIIEMLPSVELYRSEIPTAGVMRFNQLHAPFNDPKVRQAILLATDQNDFMAAAVGAENTASYNAETGVFAPGTPMGSTRGLEAITGPRDIEKAREMLKEAGVFGSQITVIDTVAIATLHSFALVGIDLFKKLGFDVKIETLDWGATLQKREVKAAPADGGWNVIFTAMVGVNNLDPIGHLAFRATGESGWFGWPKSEKIESLRDAWMLADTQDERIELAAQIQEQVFIDVPYVPLGSIYSLTAMTSQWSGYQPQMANFYTLRSA